MSPSFLDYAPVFLVAVVVGGAILLARLLLGKSETLYDRRGSLLPAERSACYHALHQAAAGLGVIHWDVSLGSLLEPRRDAAGPGVHRLLGRHVDFVVCTAESLEPIVAVMLEDGDTPSDAPERRRLIEACASAGLPLVLVNRAENYDVESLRGQIDDCRARLAKQARGAGF